MHIPYLFLLIGLICLNSCSLPPLEGERENGIIKETEPQPVEINRAAIPTFKKDIQDKAEEKEKEAPTLVKEPERKFSFRTPNLIDDLPSDNELNSKKGFKKKVDEKVDEAATIRASE